MRNANRASGSRRATTTSSPGPTSGRRIATGTHQQARAKSGLCFELQLADERGPAPGERTVLDDAHQGHIAFCRPGEQVREPLGRDPPVRLEVSVDQHDRPGTASSTLVATRRHSDQSRSRLRSTGAPGAVGAPISESERLPSSPPPLPVNTWTAMSPTSSKVQRPPCQRVRAARVAATCTHRASATKAWPPSTAQQSGGASRRMRGRSSVVAKNSRSLPLGSDSSPAPPESNWTSLSAASGTVGTAKHAMPAACHSSRLLATPAACLPVEPSACYSRRACHSSRLLATPAAMSWVMWPARPVWARTRDRHGRCQPTPLPASFKVKRGTGVPVSPMSRPVRR